MSRPSVRCRDSEIPSTEESNDPNSIIEFLDNFHPITYNALLCRWEAATLLQNIGSNISLSNRSEFV